MVVENDIGSVKPGEDPGKSFRNHFYVALFRSTVRI